MNRYDRCAAGQRGGLGGGLVGEQGCLPMTERDSMAVTAVGGPGALGWRSFAAAAVGIGTWLVLILGI
jgi:hypothetical protein